MTQRQRRDILTHVLATMPDTFTSNMFCEKLRTFGINDEFIEKGNCSLFLKKHVTRGNTRRSWIKRNASPITKDVIEVKKLHFDDTNTDTDTDTKIKDAIELLKNNGFKIQKQVQRWEDI